MNPIVHFILMIILSSCTLTSLLLIDKITMYPALVFMTLTALLTTVKTKK